MCYLKYQHDLFAYDVVWFSDILLQEFIWIDLAHAHAYLRLKKSLPSLDDLLFQNSDITFLPDSMLFCRSA